MARRRPTPSYLLHSQTGRGRAVWTDPDGTRHDRLLPGPFGSAESRTAFARLMLEMEVSPQPADVTKRGTLTVAELLLAYVRHAQRHYLTSDGRPTSTIYEVKIVTKAVRELYGELPAAEFGPLKLKAAVQGWVIEKRTRAECNRRVGIVKRMFKWAASEELVPAAVYHGLLTVGGLARGRTTAPETKPVLPVDDAVVDATLPHLNRHVRGLVEFQRLTGCRPGEACAVRRSDIDTGGAVWLYRPAEHKTAWRGKARVIAIGPKAQALLREYFTPDLDAYLFSPAAAAAERDAARGLARTTPRWPSHVARNKRKRKRLPRRAPKERYDRTSYTRAIARAVELANADLAAKAKMDRREFTPLPHWHPNQLRHTFATKVRKQHGLEAAQVLLGHSRADVTQVYAEKNEQLAVEIAAKLG